MAQASELGPIIDRIHGATLDPARWPDAVAAITGPCGAQSGIIYEYDRPRRSATLLGSPGIDPGMIRVYQQYYYKLDPWISHALSAQVGRSGGASSIRTIRGAPASSIRWAS